MPNVKDREYKIFGTTALCQELRREYMKCLVLLHSGATEVIHVYLKQKKSNTHYYSTKVFSVDISHIKYSY